MPHFLTCRQRKTCFQVAKLAVREIKSTAIVDSFHCWVLPGMGLFHLQFLKTIFDFGSRWQLRRWYLDIDDLHATNDLFFNINFRAQRQLETLFIHMSASHSLVPNQIFLRKKHSVAKKWNWENCLHVLSLPNSGNSAIWLTKKLLTMGWMQLGHVCVYPWMSQTFILRWFSPTFLENKSVDFPWMQILFMYWSRCLFLGMVQRKCRFRKLKWVYGTTQEFVSGTFRSINSNTWSRKKNVASHT